MKLRNKKTGEIIETDYKLSVSVPNERKLYGCNTYDELKGYTSLAELNEDWEDYEELKEYWYLNEYLELDHEMWTDTEFDNKLKALGNYFETKEEAEKAVEKLKAWKRLKDKGFKFNNWYYAVEGNRANGAVPLEIVAECKIDNSVNDLDLLFGVEDV